MKKYAAYLIVFTLGVASVLGLQKLQSRAPHEKEESDKQDIAIKKLSDNEIERELKKLQRKMKKESLQNNQKMDKFFDQFFDKNFFGGRGNPFKEMEEMHKKMQKMLEDEVFGGDFFGPQDFNNGYDNWFGNKFGGKPGSISQREDEANIYLDINLGNVNKETLKVSIEDGMVKISGEVREEVKEQNQFGSSSRISIQSINRSIPIPANADEFKAKIKQTDDGKKITITFPKLDEREDKRQL